MPHTAARLWRRLRIWPGAGVECPNRLFRRVAESSTTHRSALSPGARVELLEREQCFADLNDWLTSSVEQGGCVTLVHGEAGIGKTALLQEFSREQRVAPRVLWGACDALFTPRPLAPLHDIARQTQGKLLAAVNAETSRDAIFIAALDELEHGPPALVVFEDCHWADEATFDLLKFLGRRMQRTRSMLVMTYRTDEVGSRHPCRFVIGDLPCSIVRRLPLQPLSEVAVAKLAKQAGRSSQGSVQHDRRQSVLRHRSARDRRRVDPVECARRRARAPREAAAERTRDCRAREHRARQSRGVAAGAGGCAR